MDVRHPAGDRRDQEWRQRFQRVESERERDRAIYEQERRSHELQEYRRDRIEQEQRLDHPRAS